jgi:hypothetical protein
VAPRRDHPDAVVALHELADHLGLGLGRVRLLLGRFDPLPCRLAPSCGVSL